MRKAEEKLRIYVGVDLHKLQFTVCAENEETGELGLNGVSKTNSEGYEEFCEKVYEVEDTTESIVEIAVEAK